MQRPTLSLPLSPNKTSSSLLHISYEDLRTPNRVCLPENPEKDCHPRRRHGWAERIGRDSGVVIHSLLRRSPTPICSAGQFHAYFVNMKNLRERIAGELWSALVNLKEASDPLVAGSLVPRSFRKCPPALESSPHPPPKICSDTTHNRIYPQQLQGRGSV